VVQKALDEEDKEPAGIRYVSSGTREIVVGDKVKLRSFGSIGIVDSLKVTKPRCA